MKGPRRRTGNTSPGAMVYRRSMIPVFAVLLLAAASPAVGLAESPAPPPAETAVTETPAPPIEPAATAPPAGDVVDETPPPLPTTAASPAPVKPATPRQQLRILPQDPRMEAYDQFRGLYETANFEQALPHARRVVELSETDPERDHELPIAYNNLGATQYQLGDYAGAAESYRKSLELLESTQGISSRRLVVPIAGLGAVYAAQDEHALAAELYDRALAVSRRADGLFNLTQLPLIEQVADSRYAINDFAAVEKERMYALKIAEQNYGYGDERTLPPLLQLASFYESLREFIAARMMYLRARDVSYKESGGYSPMAVKSLVGIARTHRLQYTLDPETLESQIPARDEITGDVVGKVYRESRVPPPAADRTGLKAAQTALGLLRSTPDPPKALLTETLIELGDWFQSTSRPSLSLPYYAEAATILAAEQAADPLLGNPLTVPRMVFYRPPVSAARGLNTLTGQYIIRKTTFSFVVSETGEPQDITVVSSNMSEGQLSQSRRALSRAIYSPRFVDGEAVATEGVNFVGEWYEDHIPATTPAPAATPTSSAGS
ncbi:MAG: tetratricopeptide repeat protein [Steroidobacteraceae bacterium]